MRIIIKKVGKEPEMMDVDAVYRCDVISMLNTDLADTIYLSEDTLFRLWVDEEGLIKQLDLNFFISTNNPFFPIQTIVGDVIFARIKKPDHTKELYDYELDNITKEDILYMDKILKPHYQYGLYQEFRKKNLY